MCSVSNQIRNVAEVAIAVHDVSPAVETFETVFGLTFDEQWQIHDDHINVRAATVRGTQIHLIEPTAADGPVYSFLQEEGEGIHHFCLEVDDLDIVLAHFEELGVSVVPETPARHEDASYVFLHPSDTHGVLVELIAYD